MSEIDFVALQAQQSQLSEDRAALDSRVKAAVAELQAEQAVAIQELEASFAGEYAELDARAEEMRNALRGSPLFDLVAKTVEEERASARESARETSPRDVLSYIVDNEGPSSSGYGEIGEHFGITTQTARTRVEKLLEAKLVVKKQNPDNARRVYFVAVEEALAEYDAMADEE
jgi:multidrug efflux pump subunit AcrA (membrane-fusion protein)